MKKIMIIGAIGAGKSTLIKRLFGENEPAAKTQSLIYRDWLIDTPGEYSENPMFYRSLMATSHEAAALVLLHDATRERNYFPPDFSGGFPIPALGVITKLDHPQADTDRAVRLLRQSLRKGDIYFTSSESLQGIDELRSKLQSYVL
ncbi:ethanolamine utilization protein EutP [Paenibacillus baekrokdamisoli]|uniref:Ethanolamine utilization protein EutP n=1 Tax=Paenibacillus baekrokdamisoli TaxID=1712516 RepID=A0A3G9J0C6_9BACL|nr:EutP/PduV family microcompartment system protein [Paenibacillus baekrokdamisoli]MBB3071325.1 ethanolamine utilization protein EutP [Paenibacillus baekrokdamisoli]BBH24637.1 ethanolamine utilization protein EutP [Paenibacillus baekrokdamisoli]